MHQLSHRTYVSQLKTMGDVFFYYLIYLLVR